MTSVSDIGWGRYRNYEGPFFLGTQRFVLPDSPTEQQRRLAVITATEGGRYDAVNMYDRCILSVGLIQWCEASMFGTSGMLGSVIERCPEALTPLQEYCDELGYAFKQVGSKWRFHTSAGEVIDTLPEQRRLFLLDSDGTRGSWSAQSKLHAKKWAVVMSRVFEHEEARRAQEDYTVARLESFVMPDAKWLFLGPVPEHSESNWVNAARAAFLSFSANLPAVAAKHLHKYNHTSLAHLFSPAWVCGMLKELTFGPEIAIYPKRYNTIRPVLEKLYGVDLPDFADELHAWQERENIDPTLQDTLNLDSVFGLQHALIALGYDLGPKRSDGVYGAKTREAVMEFQARHGLKVDGIFGPRTRAVLLAQLMGR